ncbi:MAG TPA: chromate efflux transporter [Solirubrobacteraceae bacterium]|jgi:chromate transporter|nr:chromate efflux transporter [Solirubrobacteraceae bacterium]
MPSLEQRTQPPLRTIAREWGRIGCIGFGGPPAHVSLLRELCVARRGWLSDEQFERALAAVNLLPGPASTQLAIYCAWRLRGNGGALLGGLCFVLPGLVLILALSTLFLAGSPPLWVRGAGMGAGAAVPAVAVTAGWGVARPLLVRARGTRAGDPRARDRMLGRVLVYGVAGGVAAATVGPYLVLVLLACGALELARHTLARRPALGAHAWAPAAALAGRAHAWSARRASPSGRPPLRWLARVPLLAVATAAPASTAALAWTAFKVGALAFGGGFVIVPLMQADAVNAYHWMTHAQFLNAVALGQVTPGPVTQTVAAVGYSAKGLGGGLLAALVAFAPSFSFVLIGAARFERLLVDARVLAFLAGAAPAAAGAILGAAVPLAAALGVWWQYVLLAAAAVALLALRRGIVPTLLCAGAVGALAVLAGAPAVPAV